jgi:dTDP-4-dehydrorhamnose reductase
MELWGGIECTVNRVGDRFFDQVRRTGHQGRPHDLEEIARLGVRRLRYPVLWERVAPDGLASADWRWTDERLSMLRARGIRPIATLLHHGSGPRGTDLLDSGFPDAFAKYAGAVAERYPWLEDYTPVNEPLTTARFSALYGHWYPHRSDTRAFIQALLHQVQAIARGMRAIRAVNPAARLVQTEDGGRVYSSGRLAHQAEFENQRRWLTFDLLSGHVNPDHPLREWLEQSGADQRILDDLLEAPVPPDVLGLNYYLTSDRYLDHRLELFPPHTHGGNGCDRYADVEAVRMRPEGLAGHAAVLLDAWHRYKRPVALTEVHAGCTREEQVRWVVDAWQGALEAQSEGADVVAVTAWALFGSFDWSSLLTADAGVYEPGAFDLRAHTPRPTAVGAAWRALGAGDPLPPYVTAPGWWRRDGRLLVTSQEPTRGLRTNTTASCRPLLIVGAQTALGSAFVRACTARGIGHVALGRADLNVARTQLVEAAISGLRPWAVVNTTGFERIDDAEKEVAACLARNVEGAALLAAACARVAARFATFSTDLVFDGLANRPYVETDRPAPLNTYGVSKLEAERRVLAALPDALVVRTGAFFGPGDQDHFLVHAFATIDGGGEFRAPANVVVSPTYVPDLVNAALDLLVDGEAGVWHLASGGCVSWYDFAVAVAQKSGRGGSLIVPVGSAEMGWSARRPMWSPLGSVRGGGMSDLESAIARFVQEGGSSVTRESRRGLPLHA